MVGCPGTPGPAHWGPQSGHQPLRCQLCIQTTISSTKTPQNAPSGTQPHAAEMLQSGGHGEPPGWGRAKSPTFAWPPGCETQTSPMVSLTELTDHNLPEEINPGEVGRISPQGLHRAQKKYKNKG